jgi:hypothetical protein
MTPLPVRVLIYLRGDDGPLAGDLIEQYARGRSATWLWQQVAAALVTGPWSDLRRHPVDGIRAAVALALFFPFVLSGLHLLPQINWRPSGPVLIERVQGWPSWLPWFSALVFWVWIAKTLAGRFRRAVLLSFAVTGIGITLHSAWSTAAVLWLYPWNGPLVFAGWATIYACFLSLFTLGLWLGGRLEFSPGQHSRATKSTL